MFSKAKKLGYLSPLISGGENNLTKFYFTVAVFLIVSLKTFPLPRQLKR